MSSESVLADPTSPAKDPDDTSFTLLTEPPRHCRVLLVDADERARALLSARLVDAGYEVHIASGGADALRVLSETACHIVMTEWQIPNMNGLELCRNLRLRDDTGYIYVLMFTARSDAQDVLAGLSAGADDYVAKSTAPEEVLARVHVGRRITLMERSLRESVIENSRMSVTDPLTGLRNRRFLIKHLPGELERSRRYNHPLAILSCDIDNFKQVNDGFGHDAGDEVLTSFASRSGTCIRQEIDWIARSGGEEFVVVLPETPLSGACRVAERLREALATQPIATCAGRLSVTMSIGITALETAADLASTTTRQLLATADRYLYESKKSGRDRVTSGPVLSALARHQYPTRRSNNEIH